MVAKRADLALAFNNTATNINSDLTSFKYKYNENDNYVITTNRTSICGAGLLPVTIIRQ